MLEFSEKTYRKENGLDNTDHAQELDALENTTSETMAIEAIDKNEIVSQKSTVIPDVIVEQNEEIDRASISNSPINDFAQPRKPTELVAAA